MKSSSTSLLLSCLWSVLAVCLADPDLYSAWCPCLWPKDCSHHYRATSEDVEVFGNVPVCSNIVKVRCCSAGNLPDRLSQNNTVKFLPDAVKYQLIQTDTFDHPDNNKDPQPVEQKVRKNPPCGCYEAGKCPRRYSTPATGTDIGCLPGFETCCFLDDPWPNFHVTKSTIMIPCASIKTCHQFYGDSSLDIAKFGVLTQCYLGLRRCIKVIGNGNRATSTTQGTTRGPQYPLTVKTKAPVYTTTPKPTAKQNKFENTWFTSSKKQFTQAIKRYTPAIKWNTPKFEPYYSSMPFFFPTSKMQYSRMTYGKYTRKPHTSNSKTTRMIYG